MQLVQNLRNCLFQGCESTVRPPHDLCATHWLMRFDRLIIRCTWCRTYRPTEEENCEFCEGRDRRTEYKPKRKKTAKSKERK